MVLRVYAMLIVHSIFKIRFPPIDVLKFVCVPNTMHAFIFLMSSLNDFQLLTLNDFDLSHTYLAVCISQSLTSETKSPNKLQSNCSHIELLDNMTTVGMCRMLSRDFKL